MTIDIPDSVVEQVLKETRTIALVGASSKPSRASFRVMRVLIDQGYTVFPVNPHRDGEIIHGQKVLRNLGEIDKPIDMVDIFRRSEFVKPIVDGAIKVKAKFIWMQLGVIDEIAAQTARDAGQIVIMDRCPAIEGPRLGLWTR
jgi:predicted CoA-binding protein